MPHLTNIPLDTVTKKTLLSLSHLTIQLFFRKLSLCSCNHLKALDEPEGVIYLFIWGVGGASLLDVSLSCHGDVKLA